MASVAIDSAVARLAARDAARTEADLQADIYLLLTTGGLNLQPDDVARLEVPTGDGTRRRIDVEIGSTVIEVKRDLRIAGVLGDAEQQLAGYVHAQTARLGVRYLGILTDGTEWRLYRLHDGSLRPVSELSLNPTKPDADRLIVWLEAILATRESVPPSPLEIERRLGADSPAHALDRATLFSLWEQAKHKPEVTLKRDLWAGLLRTAFGKAFTDDDPLFVDHTLLVLTAEVIAHAVIGYDVSRLGNLTPEALTTGTAFRGAQIHGVVEADFFDWVLNADGGPAFVSDLAHRVARFDWSHVEHDVLKTLYESIIPADARASLGEYYTPDWLGDRVVAEVLTDPLNQRALDPACGSGTFLFHAARAFLSAADAANIPNGQAITDLTEHLYGMDIHPVAVTLARVTYLLAIGSQRLAAPDRGSMTVPVYLGDSLQWEQRRDLSSGADVITVSTAGDHFVEGGGMLFADELVFPRRVLKDAARFDQLVTAMAAKSSDISKRKSGDLIRPVLKQFGIQDAELPILAATFDTMRQLRASGRDHIWGYYVRNLIRPLWLAELDNHVDVLLGNPPWLRYSKMLPGMQTRFTQMSKERGLLAGPRGASGRDLSTLFVARTAELYLKDGARFAFVMPHGTLTRQPHDRFRSGTWSTATDSVVVAFDPSWDLAKAPTGFPMVSCVIFGTRTGQAHRMPAEVSIWSAHTRTPNLTWEVAQHRFTITRGTLRALAGDDTLPDSPYRKRFRQGAVLAPRALLFVNQVSAGPLGAGAGRVAVAARRTTAEKKPWKDVRSMSGTVELPFVRGVHLGETVLPFRLLDPLKAVLPLGESTILTASAIEEHPALAEWWADAEDLWNTNKVPNDPSALLDRIDFHGQLSAQLPVASHRVVYTKAGSTLAAAAIHDPRCVIDHMLYWAPVSGLDEARYLTAILNSKVLLDRVTPLQALGLFGARHFDKTIFRIPIPSYDAANNSHKALVDSAAEAEEIATSVDISSAGDFKRARTLIRSALDSSGCTNHLEAAVALAIPPLPIPAE